MFSSDIETNFEYPLQIFQQKITFNLEKESKFLDFFVLYKIPSRNIIKLLHSGCFSKKINLRFELQSIGVEVIVCSKFDILKVFLIFQIRLISKKQQILIKFYFRAKTSIFIYINQFFISFILYFYYDINKFAFISLSLIFYFSL